jgi:hypothetical protein
MRIFKNKRFHEWAEEISLNFDLLVTAVFETQAGNHDGHLAAHLYKKRIALPGRGKRGGARTIIALKKENKAFLIYGFAKNKKDNITPQELEALKTLARDFLNLSDEMIKRMLKEKTLVEVLK